MFIYDIQQNLAYWRSKLPFREVADTEWVSMTVKLTVIDRSEYKTCRDNTSSLMQQMMQYFE